MLFGIGTDIVDIRRIKKSIIQHPDKFAQRILTVREFTIFQQRQQNSIDLAAAYLSKRFAAKEAVVKAFGTGFAHGISLQHIEISNDEHGKPYLNYTKVAQDFINENNIQQSHLSLSDEKHYAIAYVVLSL